MNKTLAHGLAGLAACVLSAATLPAHALSMAKVTITEPLITVQDLDPSDGVDAGYRPGGMRVDAFHYTLGPANHVARELFGSAWVDESATSLAGAADRPNASFLAIGDRWAPSFTFTATPNTSVTVEVGYTFAGGVSDEPPSGGVGARAFASIELALVGVNNLVIDPDYGDVLDYQVVSDIKQESAEWTPGARLSAPQSNGVLRLSFNNNSNDNAIFAFRAEMVVFGNTANAAAVPEPESALLMAGGLAALAAWRRRRAAAVSSRS